MRPRHTPLLIVALVASATPSPAARAPAPAGSTATARATPKKPERTPGERQAIAILKAVQSQAATLSPEMRVWMLEQLADAWQRLDRARSADLLERAYRATREMDDERDRQERREQIARRMAEVAPGRLTSMLETADPQARPAIRALLVERMLKENRATDAAEALSHWPTDETFPYRIAMQVFDGLPKEDVQERQAIFSTALACYSTHKAQEDRGFGSGMADLLTGAYRSLPPAMVVDAVDRLLAAPDKPDDRPSKMQLAIGGPAGSASFKSQEAYRLFQLLPVLEAVAPDRAEQLRRDHPDLDALLAKYPEGLPSLRGPEEGGRTAPLHRSMRVEDGGTGGEERAMALKALQEQEASAVVASASEDPRRALDRAERLSNEAQSEWEDTPRTRALSQLARQFAAKKDVPLTDEALRTLVAAAGELKPVPRSRFLLVAAAYAMQVGEDAAARRYIERGMAVAGDLYRQDALGDARNMALKAEWPSTAVWGALAALAARLSPGDALSMVGDLPDPEIQAVVQLRVAQALLGREPRSVDMRVRRPGATVDSIRSSYDLPPLPEMAPASKPKG